MSRFFARPPATLFCFIASTLATPAATAEADRAVIERRIRAHVTFLADDLLEGRGAGTRGHEIAMAYVAAQFSRLGLEPAGTRGFQQPMRFRESKLNVEAGKFTINHSGGKTSLTPITDCIVRPNAAEAVGEISAPAVFVGFGISAPEFGYDDFATGIDVRGKVAVVLAGSPTKLPATGRAHYSRNKTAELARRGAIAIVTLDTPVEERRTPWAVSANRARFATMRLVDRDGGLFEAFPEIRASASLSRVAGTLLLKAAGKSADEIFAASTRGEPQAFPLNLEIALAGQAELGDAQSANVLGWLPGSDPTLTGDPLVVTSHLDHMGLGPAVNGDSLYNGALDNALGTAVILHVAERLVSEPRMRRPVLFASLTAEEKGLLGAYHLALNPPPRVRRFAANLNIDMPLILAPTREVLGLGAEHSSLGRALEIAAQRTGFTPIPDPVPEEVSFVRSDQYPFVRSGVPALALKMGSKSTDPKIDLAALQAEFRKTHYHQPSDDLSRSIHWVTAAGFAEMAAELVRTIANDPAPPKWNAGDFFGTRFGPKEN